MHFEGMSYAQLIADPAKTAKFKLDVRTRVSRAVDLPLGNVEVRVGRVGVQRASSSRLTAGKAADSKNK
jgi:hypothetical protein